MVISQGDVFWVELREPCGSEPGRLHPCVVIQNDVFNTSRLGSVVVSVLTSNTQRALFPGNVPLRKGEGGLPKASVAVASHLMTIDRLDLKKRIGRLSRERLSEILDGVDLVLKPRDV